MAENSCAIEADAQQQPLFPPDPAPALFPTPIPVENSDTPQPVPDVHPPSVLPDAILIPGAAPAPVASPNPSDSTQPLHKNHLHEYTQKSRIPLPVYQTVNEGSESLPKYRSTVKVDEVYYVSPNTFRNRRGAEQDAARIALEFISKKTKDDGFLLLHEDLMFCKSILSEYKDKRNLKRPMYITKQLKGSVQAFQSTLVFDGVVYTSDVSRSKKEAEQLAARAAILSLLGDAGNPKSQKTLARIITSKVELHATLQKVKDSHPSQIQPKPVPGNTEEYVAMPVPGNTEEYVAMPVPGNTEEYVAMPVPKNTEEHVAMVVNEDKEVKDAILVDGVVSGAMSEVPPTTTHFRPEFISTKPEVSSPPVKLPIEFVPSTLEEPVGYRATRAKKRPKSKNRKKAHKKLCGEQVATGTSQTAPPCSVVQ